MLDASSVIPCREIVHRAVPEFAPAGPPVVARIVMISACFRAVLALALSLLSWGYDDVRPR